MEPELSAIILAGGYGKRLGADKATLQLFDRPLIQHVADSLAPLVNELIVVLRQDQPSPQVTFPGSLKFVTDVYPDGGPLVGLYSGLRQVSSASALVVACDMPFLEGELLLSLAAHSLNVDAVVPLRGSQPEPLHAFYSSSCLPALESCLQGGEKQLQRFLNTINVHYLPLAPEAYALSFFNVNTRADLATAEQIFLAREQAQTPAVESQT